MSADLRIAIIDYGSGNLRSVQKAFERVAKADTRSCQVSITNLADDVLQADYIILPGVGAFGSCAAGLRALVGMEEALNIRVREQGRPFLGICVGMQLMAARGIERGQHKGLGWVGGTVVPFWANTAKESHSGLKVPHMGWNTLMDCQAHPILEGLAETDKQAQNAVYFAHSFVLEADMRAHVLAQSDYGGAFSAIVGYDNMVGTQFHPEKSQKLGLQILANFLQWRP